MQKLQRSKKDTPKTYAKIAQVDEKPMQKLHNHLSKNYIGTHAKIAQVPPVETRQEEGPREGDNHSIATSITKKLIDMPPSAGADAPLFDQEVEEQEEQPDLVTLRNEYATLSQQLEQLDAHKQAGQWARLYKQVQAAEARLRQAEQETPPSQTAPPEFAKQQEAPASKGGTASPTAEIATADERQEQLRAISSNLIYWRDGLKVLKQARLPKWRGSFKWQIEAKIEALQAAYAKLRAEAAKPEG